MQIGQGFHLGVSPAPLHIMSAPFFPAVHTTERQGRILAGRGIQCGPLGAPAWQIGNCLTAASHASNPHLWADTVMDFRVPVPSRASQSLCFIDIPFSVWHRSSAENLAKASGWLTMTWCCLFIIFLSSKCLCPEIKTIMTTM